MKEKLISGAQLAKELKVAPATLSRAVRKNYKVNGVSVADRAVMGANDKIKGYKPLNEPSNLASKATKQANKPKTRTNPTTQSTSSDMSIGAQILIAVGLLASLQYVAPRVGQWYERLTIPKPSQT